MSAGSRPSHLSGPDAECIELAVPQSDCQQIAQLLGGGLFSTPLQFGKKQKAAVAGAVCTMPKGRKTLCCVVV